MAPVIIGAFSIASIMLLDLPQTIGFKSYLLVAVPISGESKAEIVSDMCKRSHPKNWFACYEATAFESWRMAYAKKSRDENDIFSLCTFINSLTNKQDADKNYNVVSKGENHLISGKDIQITYNSSTGHATILSDKGMNSVNCK